MNYLAHCYLSCSDEDILIGNFITDFIRKKDEPNYSGGILQGIMLHRKIDSFTDSHPASLTLRRMLSKRHGKYASVVVDLVWDHFLITNWRKFSGQELSDFNKMVYEIITKRKAELPPKLADKIESMVRSDFLMAYSDEARMAKSLAWMDNRVSFPSSFHMTIQDIEDNREEMNQLFMTFFPELIAFTESFCSC